MFEPLNLQKILVEYIAGSMEIFFFLALIVIGFLAAKYRMPNKVLLIMVGVFILFMALYYELLYVLLILIVGLFFYYLLTRLIKS